MTTDSKRVTSLRRIAVLALSMLAMCAAAAAQATTNLAAQGWYADPEIHVFAGQYWIYPTSSLSESRVTTPPRHDFNAVQTALRAGPVYQKAYLLQTSLDALSSPDLVHWVRHAAVLDVKNIAWAAYAVWAPSAILLNDRYYLFFAANDLQKTQMTPGGIGVAVSDRPDGPFVDALGKPLVGEFHNGAQPIDPFVYKDHDGTIYLYYGGQGHCNVVRLSPDLKHVVPMKDGALYREITPANYVEGPFLFERKGTYYFMWSEGDWTNSSYGVAYATSSSPTGPFQRVGKILTTDPQIANGPGHHSILEIPGTDEWYIVYHRHPLGTTGGNDRVLAIDRMSFAADGSIQPIVMTKDGPGVRLLTR